ncbi:MAG: hypothetical protein A3H35_12920 [Betaproteobacteria bacterium RIFCSPLOWO2_02_FULL_62_17]|nr:MAG: hypothetical protein A3H35_12920 [Betaproteobacteria bacterium RIFCSPLOWO2_02_FULL_62_17]
MLTQKQIVTEFARDYQGSCKQTDRREYPFANTIRQAASGLEADPDPIRRGDIAMLGVSL